MAVECLMDFGPHKLKLCLVTGHSWVDLGPGKQWVPEEIATHPYFKQTSFKVLDTRTLDETGPEPVSAPAAVDGAEDPEAENAEAAGAAGSADEGASNDGAPPKPRVTRTRTS
jgi:hypothetical protein